MIDERVFKYFIAKQNLIRLKRIYQKAFNKNKLKIKLSLNKNKMKV